MTLEEVVTCAADTAISYLLRSDTKDLPLVTCLGFRPGDKTPIVIALRGSMKPEVAIETRKILRDEGCDCYAFVTEVWVSRISATTGVAPNVAEDREDGLTITAATRNRVIVRAYIIRRMEAAPGIELFKHREVDTAKAGVLHGAGGLWGQLLAPEFDATGHTGYFDQKGWHAGALTDRPRKKGAC